METVAILKGFHARGVCAVGFSRDGEILISVGLDDDHSIAFWDWKKNKIITSEKASKDKVFWPSAF